MNYKLIFQIINLTKEDIRNKSDSYKDAMNALAKYLSTLLSPLFCIDYNNNENFFLINNIEKINIPENLFEYDNSDNSNYDKLNKEIKKFSHQIVRIFTNNIISECDTSDSELINLNHSTKNILDNKKVILTQKTKSIFNNIEKFNKTPIIVIGNSSSGKTIAVAQAVTNCINIYNVSYTWIDLADVNVEIEHFLFTASDTIKNNKHIFIVDNAQSQPSKLTWLIKALEYIYKKYPQHEFSFVCISWRSAKSTIFTLLNKNTTIECMGDDIIKELIRVNNLNNQRDIILNNSAGDVLVAKSTINYFVTNNSFPDERSLAKMIYEDFINDAKLQIGTEEELVLYTLAALGEFEIHVRDNYLINISKEGYTTLLTHNLIRIYNTEDNHKYVSIGHRSLAHKICVHLATKLTNEKPPLELAIEYLSTAGDKQILSTLERLDFELETGDKTFSELWQAFCRMKAYVTKQISDDATWGNNMASMIFAAEALSNMKFENGTLDLWSKTATEIRRKWSTTNNHKSIICLENESTSELDDFENSISKTMSEDEKLHNYPENMQSEKINYQKFHDNWLLGLLLGFEGFSIDNIGNKENYIECAKEFQQTDGSFYPERVPWVTARVIMGLCLCGLSYSSDPIVMHACNWLVDQIKDQEEIQWKVSKIKCGGWRSGTGTWNSNEQITLQCLVSLYMAQYPVNTITKTKKIVSEFWNNRKELEKQFKDEGHQLDFMWITDVMLFDNRNPLELKDEIKEITDYLFKSWNTANIKSSEKDTESSDVSFMAKELIQIIWRLLQMNLEQLLKGLEIGYTENKEKKIFISYRRVDGGGSLFAQEIYKALNSKYPSDVFLDVYDLHDECREFNDILDTAIDTSKVVIAVISDHSFDRACNSNYNNNEDVLYNELNKAINIDKNIIVVYNNEVELPDDLRINLDFYNVAKKLSEKNATFYKPSNQDAINILADEIINKIENLQII